MSLANQSVSSTPKAKPTYIYIILYIHVTYHMSHINCFRARNIYPRQPERTLQGHLPRFDSSRKRAAHSLQPAQGSGGNNHGNPLGPPDLIRSILVGEPYQPKQLLKAGTAGGPSQAKAMLSNIISIGDVKNPTSLQTIRLRSAGALGGNWSWGPSGP